MCKGPSVCGAALWKRCSPHFPPGPRGAPAAPPPRAPSAPHCWGTFVKPPAVHPALPPAPSRPARGCPRGARPSAGAGRGDVGGRFWGKAAGRVSVASVASAPGQVRPQPRGPPEKSSQCRSGPHCFRPPGPRPSPSSAHPGGLVHEPAHTGGGESDRFIHRPQKAGAARTETWSEPPAPGPGGRTPPCGRTPGSLSRGPLQGFTSSVLRLCP